MIFFTITLTINQYTQPSLDSTRSFTNKIIKDTTFPKNRGAEVDDDLHIIDY